MTKHKYKQVGEFFVKDENIVCRLTTLLTKKEQDKINALSRYVYNSDIKKLINKQTKKITFNNKSSLITPIKNSDPNTFKYFSLRWTADKNQVYHYTKPTKKIDVKSFEHLITVDPIFNALAKDKNFVYNIIDVKTFKILSSKTSKAEDVNYFYYVIEGDDGFHNGKIK